MTEPTVTEADGELVASIAVALMGDYASEQLAPRIRSGEHDGHMHVQAVVAFREAAERAGAEAERKAVLAWLDRTLEALSTVGELVAHQFPAAALATRERTELAIAAVQDAKNAIATGKHMEARNG